VQTPQPPRGSSPNRSSAVLAACAFVAMFATAAFGQVGRLVSPGPLSRAHAKLEGIDNCQKCHEPGHQVSASRCLTCHKAVAERIAAGKGVHRGAADSCVKCHSEHAGVDAELRPFDTRRFDHAKVAGFPLDGRHAAIAGECAKCHKTRSFLTAQPACSTCHADIHKGALGGACVTCHPTSVAFADARRQFDHARAKFALVGAHRAVECAKCHVNKVFTGLKFASCTDCHREPHRRAFGVACASCHNNDTWRTQKVDHARTAFPLRGAHATAACAACHVKPAVQVRLTATRCADCHVDVHRGQFKGDCGSCHTDTRFGKAPFDHSAGTRFALTGKHVGVACAKCHKDAALPGRERAVGTGATKAVLFRGASSACSSCHEDVHRGGAGSQCETCHATSDFHAPKPYDHPAAIAAFFAGKHAAASTTCADCHGRVAPLAGSSTPTPARTPAETGKAAVPVTLMVNAWRFKGLGTACATCHADPHGGEFAGACDRCHAIDEPRFAATKFSHASTGFPLTGKHKTAPCSLCHKPKPGPPARGMSADDGRSPARVAGPVVRLASLALTPARRQPPQGGDSGTAMRFKGVATECSACHKDIHLGQLGTKCQSCHTADTFSLAKYVHKDPTLGGLFTSTHATLACRACHKKETGTFPAGTGVAVRYSGFGKACATCHTSDDAHHGELGAACEDCHVVQRWQNASRAFHKSGVFPLEGRHLAVPCASCHLNGVTKGTPTQCADCHWVRRHDDPYETRLGIQCETCHRPVAWTAVDWNHAARTGFALNVAHQVLRCDSCHKDRRFVSTSANCYGCHQAAYQRTTSPNHAAAGFPLTCEVCHQASQTSWAQAAFNHTAFFPLVGVHTTQACATCHRNNVYAGTPSNCAGCHMANYQRTTSPNHAAAGIPTTCEQCHRPSDATFASSGPFNHNAFFPLVGVHATQACATCHKNNVYAGTPSACVGCHLANYQKTTNPNHAAAGMPTTCDQCHRPSDPSWTASGPFNHSAFFPLVGVHASQACATCHKNNVYAGTPSACVGCHLANYQKTTNPNHAAAGFGTSCDQCHRASDAAWTQGSFNHASVFPLVGVHATQACAACHTSGNYASAPTTCVGCHLANYQQTTNPNHASAGFGTTCDQCHRPTDATWLQGTFNHASVFALVGVHATQACTACHANGNFASAPTTCVGCHLTNYQQTTNPNHAAAGFPTTCDTCHKATDASWLQATFAHTRFPITSGAHAGRPCAACHTTPNAFAAFSCTTGCHDRATTDSHHIGRSGYRYDSLACYACHPNGRAGRPRP
jgi:hypothetical protein